MFDRRHSVLPHFLATNLRLRLAPFDADGNSILSDQEISGIRHLYLTPDNTQGVEYLTALEHLECTGAFKGMKKLTSVTIGANVKTIGKGAFQSCAKLKTITLKTKKLTSSSVKSNAFKGIYKKATFKCPSGKKDAYKKLLLKKGAPKTCKFK